MPQVLAREVSEHGHHQQAAPSPKLAGSFAWNRLQHLRREAFAEHTQAGQDPVTAKHAEHMDHEETATLQASIAKLMALRRRERRNI